MPRHVTIANRLTITALAVLAAILAGLGTRTTYHLWLDRHDATYWFEYDSVEHTRTEPDALVFTSTATWRRPITRVVWTDQLQCLNPGSNSQWQRFSQQTIEAPEGRDPVGPTVTEWPYTAPRPTTGTCRMQSTITIGADHGIDKQQILYSAPFDLGTQP